MRTNQTYSCLVALPKDGSDACDPCHDLSSVAVDVSAPEELHAYGVQADSLRTHIANRLQQHGIAVTEADAAPDAPRLQLLMEAEPFRVEPVYSVATELQLLEPVTLRRTAHTGYAVTWVQARHATYADSYLARGASATVDTLLDQFLTTYHAIAQTPDAA